jgi:hypothetical protein
METVLTGGSAELVFGARSNRERAPRRIRSIAGESFAIRE